MHTSTSLFIDGVAQPATGGAVYDIHNPARPLEQVGSAAAASLDDVDAAIGRADV